MPVHGSVIVFALICAWLIRRVLRTESSDWASMDTGNRNDIFHALAIPVVYGGVVLIVSEIVTALIANGSVIQSEPVLSSLGINSGVILLKWIEAVFELAAVTTIAVIAFCYRKKWINALIDLMIWYFIFRIFVEITAIITQVVSPFSSAGGFLLDLLMSETLPETIGNLMDQAGYTVLVLIIDLGVIGAAWLAAKEGFEKLLKEGNVKILDTLDRLMKADSSPPQNEKN